MSEPYDPPHRATPLARYGPLCIVVAAIVIVAVLASVGNGGGSSTRTGAGAATTTTVGTATDPNEPVLYSEAKAAGTLARYDFGSRCDPKTGRLKIPSVYSPPCIPVFTGANGGATFQGVSATTVKVVVYVAAGNDLTSALQGLSDPPAAQEATRVDFVNMFNHLFETYGRQVQLIEFKTTADPTDAEAADADAIKVADQIKPFASLGGPAETPAYAHVLAQHHILCISCGISLPDETFQQNAPYMWGETVTPEQFLLNLTGFIGHQLLNKPAIYAGDPAMRRRKRVFGVVHFEDNPPVFSDVDAEVAKETKGSGYKPAVNLTYILDVPTLGERAATIIAKLKQAKVTTVVFLGDPLMPIYLTKEATAQHYFPEWIVTGTVLTDTTVFGRQYDPLQWKHAFGISTLPARYPLHQQEPWRLTEWYYGRAPQAPNTSAVVYTPIWILMLGIDMAGPDLTPQTFARGMFRYPPSGGGPTDPHVSFGNHGYFAKPDYITTDDVTLIWWDPTAVGPDEQGHEKAPGMWRYVDGGKRYLPGHMPTAPVPLFKKAGTITVYDHPPAASAYPDYPSPAKKPGG